MPLVGHATSEVEAPCLGILSEEGSLCEQSTKVFPTGAAGMPPDPFGSPIAGSPLSDLDPWGGRGGMGLDTLG